MWKLCISHGSNSIFTVVNKASYDPFSMHSSPSYKSPFGKFEVRIIELAADEGLIKCIATELILQIFLYKRVSAGEADCIRETTVHSLAN